MVQKHITKTDMRTDEYRSCIRINGVPILPPLITPERRMELQNYKKRAVDIERRLKCQQNLKFFIDQLDSHNQQLGNKRATDENSNPFNRTLEHLLAFGNDNSHVDALNIQDISHRGTRKLPFKDCKTRVPSKELNHKASKLTYNIFDVSQYSDSGIVLFNSDETSDVDMTLLASSVELDLTSSSYINDSFKQCSPPPILESATPSDSTSSPHNTQVCLEPTPRLRSNSYTLDSPSPLLLEQFKKQAEMEQNNSFESEEPKRKSVDLSDVDKNDQGATSKWKILHRSPSVPNKKKENTSNTKGCDFISFNNISQAVEDLAQIHFGANKRFDKTKSEGNLCNTTITNQNDSQLLSTEIALHEVLQTIPESHAKEIMELLDRHKTAQEMQLEFNRTSNFNLSGNNEFDPLQTQKIVSDDETKSVYYDSQAVPWSADTSTDTVNALDASTTLLIDFESDSEVLPHFETYSSCSEINSDPLHVLGSYTEVVEENKSANCSRELFPEKPAKVQRKLREQWAARVLTAAAKGYLVRRLKRTERVKHLIQTIQDALVCAMSLHMENFDSIRTADVELHRRLIQQVSAACYEFHDIFFSLTTKEQMNMIAIDRQKLLDKLKKPKSNTSSLKDSDRSTPKSRTHSFNMRQRKNLTPSFAA